LIATTPQEVEMFVRSVSLILKPNTIREFVKAMDCEVIPLLRKQKGFQEAITLAVPGGREVVAISFWQQKEYAQAYNSTGYPEVLKILERFLDGTPHVRTFDVVSSTVQKVNPPMAA
jgi:hypothetical protein